MTTDVCPLDELAMIGFRAAYLPVSVGFVLVVWIVCQLEPAKPTANVQIEELSARCVEPHVRLSVVGLNASSDPSGSVGNRLRKGT